MKLAIVLLSVALSAYYAVVSVNNIAHGHYVPAGFYLAVSALWTVVVFRQKGRA